MIDQELRPTIEEHEDGFLVSLPTAAGMIRFNAEGIEQPRRHVLEVELTTWVEQPGQRIDPFTGHLNVLSLSSRESYRRQLDEQFPSGKGYWTPFLNRACAMIREAWQEKDWSVDLRCVPTQTDTHYLLHPFLLEGLPVVMFGAGGSGKTYVALAMAKAVAVDGEFLGRRCDTGAVLFLDYEARKEDVKKRLLLLGMPEDQMNRVIYWPGRGRPLIEVVSPVGRLIRERGVKLVIVDSAALACGGDPKEEHVATAYFNALAKLGVSSLTIAHVTGQQRESNEEQRRPYGSIFWENSARATWNVRAAEDEENPKHLGLFCRKANEDIRPRPIGLRLSFELDAVRLEREELTEELYDGNVLLSQRIRRHLLRYGKQTVKDIAESLNVKPGSVYVALRRMRDALHEGGGRGRGDEGVWMIATADEPRGP